MSGHKAPPTFPTRTNIGDFGDVAGPSADLQKTAWQRSKRPHTFTVHFGLVEYPSGQRTMTVNHFGYAVHWFDSSLHHQFLAPQSGAKNCPP
jgi:hypothetical protein